MDARGVRLRIVRLDGAGEQNPEFVIDGGRWRIPSDGLEGFGGVEYSVSTADYAQYDGAYLLGERVPARDRTVTAHAFFDRAAARREAERFFIPRRAYEVHCEYMGRARYFTGRQYALDLSTDNVHRRQVLTWTCLSLEPLWLSEDEKRFNLAGAQGKRGFAFCSFARRVGTGAGVAGESHIAGHVAGVIAKEIWMENDGCSTAYPRFEVLAHGAVANPVLRVSDSTGAEVIYLALKVDLKAGDELSIDFSARPTAIELNGANASNLIRVGSTLAAGIEVGRFRVEWSADSGDAALEILPSIRERYTAA